ncbi:amidase [Nocardia sp. NPDC052566]|uniref:amidase n=1 Tax=Nocardia sp. NPDC052566 TaxID=3364330 RepID=UPI0037C5AEB1
MSGHSNEAAQHPVIHAFGDDALGELDAVGVAERIRSGALDRRAVIEAAIARIERVDPTLGALRAECFDWARHAAVDDGAPFAGVPTVIKDNNAVAALPTGMGSAAVRPHPATRTDPPARQLLAQGVVLLGKSAMPEFGLTPVSEYAGRPPTRNPWHTDRSAGGSSAGSGALVAAGAVPIAHGNDAGGSIRIPAAANGLVGLKVTRGRLLDVAGVRQLPVNLVVEGVLTRTVRDTAHYLASAEKYYHNRKLPRVGLVAHPSDRRLRIGLLTTDTRGVPAHPAMAEVARSAAALLERMGHDIETVDSDAIADPRLIEDFQYYWGSVAMLIVIANQVEHGRHFDPRDLEPFTRGLMAQTARHPLATARGMARLRRAHLRYEAVFLRRNLDIVLSPVLGQPIPLLGELATDQPFDDLLAKLTDYVAFTPVENVTGSPAIAVPYGMTADGIPGSIHLSAGRGGERLLLELAYELEAAAVFPRIQDQP